MENFYEPFPLYQQTGRAIRKYIAPKLFLHFPWILPKRFLPRPWRLYLDLGPACTCRCQQCDFWKLPPSSKNDLKLFQRKEIVDKFYHWLGSSFEILFTGGEPLLRKLELLELIRWASRKGIRTGLVSNGTLLDKNTAKELSESGLSKIDISLDGINNKTHDYLRGLKGVCQKAKKAIIFLNEVRAKRIPPMSLKITTVLMKQNLEEIPEIVMWAEKRGADGVRFNALFSKTEFGNQPYNGDWWKNNFLWPSYNRVSKTIDKLIKMRKKGLPIANTITALRKIKQYYKNPVEFGKSIIPCPLIEKNYFLIDVTGDVRLCPFYPPMGKILEQPPLKIWQNRKSTQVRNLIMNCPRECKTCFY